MASRFYVDVTLTSIHERYAFGSFENKQSVFIPGAANLIHPKWKKMTDLFKLGQLVAVIAREQETITNGCQYIALSVCSYEEVIETTGEVIKADVGADRKSFLLRTPNQGEVFLPCSAINKYRKSLLEGGLSNTPSALRVGDRVKVYIMRQPPPLTVPDASSWSVVKLSDHASSEELEPVAHSINKESRWSSVDSSETSGEKADSEEDNSVFKSEVGSRVEREGGTVSRSINKKHSENGGDKRVKSPVSPNSFHFPSVAASKGSDDSFVSPLRGDHLPAVPRKSFDGYYSDNHSDTSTTYKKQTPSCEQPQSSQETQTEQPLEAKIAMALMNDAVCFDIICRKHPELARDWTLARLVASRLGSRKI